MTKAKQKPQKKVHGKKGTMMMLMLTLMLMTGRGSTLFAKWNELSDGAHKGREWKFYVFISVLLCW